ncbi:MAG TPA: nicotinamide riboside transporter PnuC [Candidatus Dormibacteraeota bacterium]|jgi:nicotinamide mononucleotide transporter|nr:nicotinamide riboside transporter PnuC [Candidatus Dormibacteraeota bacterium]
MGGDLQWTEVAGFTFGIATVGLIVRESIWNWPTAILMAGFYCWVFFVAKLYADVVINAIFIPTAIYGWVSWLRGREGKSKMRIRSLSRWHVFTIVAALLVVTPFAVAILIAEQDSSAYLDGASAALALVAEYLLTRKFIENWLFWVGADVIYIVLYVSRHLYLTAVLCSLFIILSVVGWRQWRASQSQPSGGLVDLPLASV